MDAGGPAQDSGPPVADGGSSDTCSLSVTVTTSTANGPFAPGHVTAIWVATDTGAFIKTLGRWAEVRAGYLILWNSVSAAAGSPGSILDAITGSTRLTHGTLAAKWNCIDSWLRRAPDGAYRVYFEFNEGNDAGPNAFVSFTKGPTAVTLTPPDTTNFKSIRLEFTP
jgi:hypothetical protein